MMWLEEEKETFKEWPRGLGSTRFFWGEPIHRKPWNYVLSWGNLREKQTADSPRVLIIRSGFSCTLHDNSQNKVQNTQWNLIFTQTLWIYGWYIYLHEWLIFMVNVGKYTSPMDPMGNLASLRVAVDLSRCGFKAIRWYYPNHFRMMSSSPFYMSTGGGFLASTVNDQSEIKILQKSVLWVYSMFLMFLDEGVSTTFFGKNMGNEVFGTNILGKSRVASQDHQKREPHVGHKQQAMTKRFDVWVTIQY